MIYDDYNDHTSWEKISHKPLNIDTPWSSLIVIIYDYMTGWWYTYSSEKYEFVSWYDYSQLNGQIKNAPNQVAGASGAWRFYSVSASKRLFSTLLAVVGVVVFHQLCQLFQHDQWCTSLEITSPHILEVTTSQRWIHLWPHQSLHFSVKIGKHIQRTCSSVASRSCVNWSERAVA